MYDSEFSRLGKHRDRRAEQALHRLQEAIASGELKPNQHLVERDLAGILGMSRTPIREALRRLEATAYITRLPTGGIIVTDHSPKQIHDLYGIRKVLEGQATKLACERYEEDQIVRLEEYHERCIEAIRSGKIEQFCDMNSAFHLWIYNQCGNAYLINLIMTFRDERFFLRVIRKFTDSDWRITIDQHGGILKAVRKRNARNAQEVMEQHLERFAEAALHLV
jgi:DNA-binding GntR family transcriptional regulator